VKASVEAPSNIAFVKYWGARDLERAIPNAPSISMTLRSCRSLCTVVFHEGEGGADEVWLVEEGGACRRPDAKFIERACRHLGQLRTLAGKRGRFVVGTRNTFPSAAGIASSASGFAALTIAGLRALGRDTGDPRELSSLARLSGSGSAARSVMGGYVEWPRGEGDDECFAFALAPAGHWDLRDLVVVVESEAKKVPSRDGHALAATSPHYARRLELLPERLAITRAAIHDRDLERLGPVIEDEGIELHLIAMSSRPPVYYWSAATIDVLARVRELRAAGVAAFSTMDAGANVHVICTAADEPAVAGALEAVTGVKRLIRDGVGDGPRALDEHLL
jgi:diphosphomevalonate decarboxylase